MKKLILIVLCSAIIFSAVSCKKKETTAKEPDKSTEQVNEEVENKEENKMPPEVEAYYKELAGQGTAFPQLDPPKVGDTIATVKTSMGDIKIKLFPDKAPKAVENFVTHAKDGYYNNLIFHRIIDGFMIQGGDPTGTGTGGESIWKQDFEDEFSTDLYNLRGALSMANRGQNTNGSQFFIVQSPTVEERIFDMNKEIIDQYGTDDILVDSQTNSFVRVNYSDKAIENYKTIGGAPNLDYKHTVFGQVFEGMDIVDDISSVATDVSDKPSDDVVIKEIEISEYK